MTYEEVPRCRKASYLQFNELNRYMRFLGAVSHEVDNHLFIILRFYDKQCFYERCGSDHNNSGLRFRCDSRTDNMELFT